MFPVKAEFDLRDLYYDDELENSPRAGNLNHAEHFVFGDVSFDGTESRSQSDTRSGRSSRKGKKRPCSHRDMFGRCRRYASSPYVNGVELCARHGGGHRCAIAGCLNHGIDHFRRCRAHGGGKRCSAPGCDKSAQSGTGGGVFCRAHFLAQSSGEDRVINPAIGNNS